MKTYAGLLTVTAVALASLALGARAAEQGAKNVGTHVYELRVYTVEPGRMDALKARFRNHTNKLLEKHGMKLVGFWTPTKPEDADKQLIYIVEHPSQETAKKNWDAFRADPEWKVVREA